MNTRSRALRLVLLFAAATTVAFVGCTWSPTGPTTVTPGSHDVFEGRVYPGGQTLWPFALTIGGTVTLSLVSLDPGSLTVGLGLGDKTAHGCDLTTQTRAAVGAPTPQITVSMPIPGEKCAVVFDAGVYRCQVRNLRSRSKRSNRSISDSLVRRRDDRGTLGGQLDRVKRGISTPLGTSEQRLTRFTEPGECAEEVTCDDS
jgi:hypothetical protein